MQSIGQKEDLKALARDYVLGWEHLPYRSLYNNDLNAAYSYLGQFPQFELGSYSPSGELFLYTEPNMLVGVRYLTSESNNLGFHCARMEPVVFKHSSPYGVVEIEPAARFLRGVLASLEGPSHLSAIADSSNIFTQHVLQSCGFHLADTIGCYHIPITKLPALEIDPAIREARSDDVPHLSAFTATCFSHHRLNINRFNTEPLFSNDSVGKTYSSWLAKAIIERAEDHVLVFDDGKVSGFLTLRLPPKHETKFGVRIGRFILAGVDPERHGRGIYRRIIMAGLKWLRDQDVPIGEGKMHLSNY
ncbi:MAG: hypothetical protein C5B53_05710, partial [Candidatus Melainabacteria bacterium]